MQQAVEIDGDPYRDGSDIGNPAIWPLIYHCSSADAALTQINPLVREGVPRTPIEIENRLNENAFNSSLMHEMRSIAFVQRLLEHGALAGPLAGRYKNMRIHMISDAQAMKSLGVASIAKVERAFLEHLKAAGRAAAERWLAATIGDTGVRSSVDIRLIEEET